MTMRVGPDRIYKSEDGNTEVMVWNKGEVSVSVTKNGVHQAVAANANGVIYDYGDPMKDDTKKVKNQALADEAMVLVDTITKSSKGGTLDVFAANSSQEVFERLQAEVAQAEKKEVAIGSINNLLSAPIPGMEILNDPAVAEAVKRAMAAHEDMKPQSTDHAESKVPSAVDSLLNGTREQGRS